MRISEKNWSVYLLDCDGRYYTGIALDPVKRLEQHRSGKQGAKFTRGAACIEMRYCVMAGSRSAALRVEARLKKQRRAVKQNIIDTQPGKEALFVLLRLETI